MQKLVQLWRASGFSGASFPSAKGPPSMSLADVPNTAFQICILGEESRNLQSIAWEKMNK